MDLVYKSTLKLLSTKQPEKIFQVTVREAMKMVGAKYGSIFVYRDGRMRRIFTTDIKLHRIIPRRGGNTMKVYSSGGMNILPQQKIAGHHPLFAKLKVDWDINVALIYGDTKVGVLSLLLPKDKIATDIEIKRLQVFAPIATLAIRNNLLQRDLNQALESRDLFVSLAAHELKTPLTSSYAYAQLLAKKLHQNEEIKNITSRLIHELKREARLIDELLEVSRIKSGKLDFQLAKTDLVEIIERSIQNFKANFPRHEVVFKNELKNKKAWIRGDADKLQQMLTNIMGNAGKFSPKNTPLAIFMTRDQDNFEISVLDRGVGIARKDLKNIFDLFYRGSDKGKSGLGLGLFLAKHIAERHGGDISLKSTLGKGTKVIIRLPEYD
jgi:signal transduction histidine kinase